MKNIPKALEILIPYQDQWVILSKNRTQVIDADQDLERLHNRIQEEKMKDVFLMYVTPMTGAYVA